MCIVNTLQCTDFRFRDDVRIQPDERYRMSEEDAIYTFTITGATLDDDAEYTCTAKNAAGSASTTAELFVNAAGEYGFGFLGGGLVIFLSFVP